MAFVTESNRPQPLRQPPPTACLLASGTVFEVPSFPASMAFVTDSRECGILTRTPPDRTTRWTPASAHRCLMPPHPPPPSPNAFLLQKAAAASGVDVSKVDQAEKGQRIVNNVQTTMMKVRPAAWVPEACLGARGCHKDAHPPPFF